MRSAHSRPVTVGLATGLFVISSGATGTALAATSPTATASTAAASTASATEAASSPSATQAATSPSAAAPTASPTPTPTPSTSSSGSGGGSASGTDPTPTPTPTTSTPPPAPVADITVTASATSVQAGGTILFRISAYTNVAPNGGGAIATLLTPSAKTPAFSPPTFTVGCDSTSGTTCNLNSVPTTSQPNVEVQVKVPKNAPAGETIGYKATLTVKEDAGSNVTMTANAPKVTVAKAATTSPSPSPTKSKSSGGGGTSTPGATPTGSTTTIPGLSGTTEAVGTSIPIGPLPAVAGVSTTIPGGNASSLFPQITPSPSPSPAAGTKANPKGAQPVADSSRIPLALGSSEFGAQILGLIVLLLGVAIAVTRLSLRKTRTTGSK
jgi:hypothetical protein